MIRDITAILGQDVTGIGYQFFNDSGLIGARVTTGIDNPSPGVYVKRNVTPTTGATGVHWDNTAGDIFADEIFDDAAGTGAFVVTATVTDGTDPIVGAAIQITDGITPAFGVTNASGQAVFSLNAGTYTVSITKAGYQFTPSTRTVTGNEAGTLTDDLEMAAVTIPSVPADPTKGTVYGSVIMSDGGTKAGVAVTARLVGSSGPYKVGPILIPRHHSTITNAAGQWSLDLYGNADITPAGTFWMITIAAASFEKLVTAVAGEIVDCDALV